MDLQPTLRGELLWLRPLVPEDFESLFAISSDPKVWEQHPENTRYKREVFEKFFQGAVESKGALVAIENKTGTVIGTSRFNAFDPQAKRVEIGYTFLSRACWGKGFNREMKALMLTHAFQNIERVVFYIGEHNRRSRAAIERIGAKHVETIPRQPKQGAAYNAAVYAIERLEFLSGSLI
jgi:N-acetyltransferase